MDGRRTVVCLDHLQVGGGMTDDIETLIAETRRLCAEATPEPWSFLTKDEAGEDEELQCRLIYGDEIGEEGDRGVEIGFLYKRSDLALAAHARTALERLCDEVERLRAVNWDGFKKAWVQRQESEPDEGLAEQLPRVWMGKTVGGGDVGFWVWAIHTWVWESLLSPRDVFVHAGIGLEPTIDPRTMKSIATCSEVDW